MKKWMVILAVLISGSAWAGKWQRNTFPSTKHVEAGFAPGAGWSHMEDTTDVSVSPLDVDYDLVTNAIPTTGSQNFIRLQINEQ